MKQVAVRLQSHVNASVEAAMTILRSAATIVLDQCWADVLDGGQTLDQHRVDVYGWPSPS